MFTSSFATSTLESVDPGTRRNKQKRDFVAYFRVARLTRVSRKKPFFCLNKKVDSQQHVISRAPTSNFLIQKKTRHCGGREETHLSGIKIPAGQGRALHFYLKIGSTFSIPLDASFSACSSEKAKSLDTEEESQGRTQFLKA